MSFLELPATLVEILNTYLYEESVNEPALRRFQSELETTLRRVIPRSQTQEANLANACYLADQILHGLHVGAPLDPLMTASYALNAELGKLQHAARGVTFVTIPELDNLLVTVEAIYLGHLAPDALAPALAEAQVARTRLARRCRLLCLTKALKAPLKGEVQKALKDLRRGLTLLETELVEGARAVRAAAEQLEPLERGPKAMPVHGMPLDLGFLLVHLAKAEPAQALRDEFYANWYQELITLWEGMRGDLLLQPALHDATVGEVEDALDWLADDLELDAAELKSAVQDLLESWMGLQKSRLSIDAVWGTGLERLALALVGVWQGRVPDMVLTEIIGSYRSVAWNAEIRQRIVAYLRTGERDWLLSGLEAVVEVAPHLHLPETYLWGRQCVRCYDEYGEETTTLCHNGQCHCYFEASA
jgi:hypothetical protein